MSPMARLGDRSGFVPLVVKYAGDFWNTADGYDLWYQDSGAGGRVGFGIGTEGGRWRKHASLTTVLLPAHIYHIVGTFDGSYARLYVNGEEVAATPHDQPLSYPKMTFTTTAGSDDDTYQVSTVNRDNDESAKSAAQNSVRASVACG